MDAIETWLAQRRRQLLKRRLYAAVDYRATLVEGEWVREDDLRRMTRLSDAEYEGAMAELVAEGYLEATDGRAGRRFRLTAQEAWGIVPEAAVAA